MSGSTQQSLSDPALLPVLPPWSSVSNISVSKLLRFSLGNMEGENWFGLKGLNFQPNLVVEFQPLNEKYAQVEMASSSPNFRGENKQYLKHFETTT